MKINTFKIKYLKNQKGILKIITFFTIGGIFLFLIITTLFPSKNALIKSSSFKLPSPRLTTWLWRSPLSFTDNEMESMFLFCKQQGIKTIYLEIDDYIWMDNQMKLSTYNTAVTKFLTTASQYGIQVQGLGGDTDWVNSPNNSLPSILLKYVLDYNNSHQSSVQFEGMQYDIEFYNLSDFSTNKTTYLIKYLTLVKDLIAQVKADSNTTASKFQLGFATPFWFGNEATIPQITWNGQTKYMAYHLLDILNTLPGSYNVLMDYRNYTSGADGSIAHAKDEMDYAEKYASDASIIVGQETTNAQPSKTTFYGLGKTLFNTEMVNIKDAFINYSVFKGIAIHDLSGYIML